MWLLIDLLIVGAVAGVLSGLLGIGGGIVVVPVLAYLFQHTPNDWVPKNLSMQMAIASSLAAILFASIVSAWSHHHKGSVRWDIWKKWLIGLCVGAVIGAILATLLNANVLRLLFAFFLLSIVVKLLIGKWLPKISLPQNTGLLLFIGLVVGIASGLLGVGGGVLMVPTLIGLGCSMPESAGTSSASTVPLVLIGSLSFIIVGDVHGISASWSTGYIYWPAVLVIGAMGVLFAPLGVKLSYVIPSTWLTRLLGFILLVISIHMLV